jgi:uncharacterized membrane protein
MVEASERGSLSQHYPVSTHPYSEIEDISMKDAIHFSREDWLLWLGIFGFSGIFILIMSVFTIVPITHYMVRISITIMMMFIPGYVTMKLFFDHMELTEYKVLDRFIVPVIISAMTVQPSYFLVTYLRTYGLKIDEDVINSDFLAALIAILVTAIAFGIKFLQARMAGLREQAGV